MKALSFTLKWEGGFSNDKYDPGGKTKYGISDAGDGTVDGLVDINGDGKGDVKVEELTRAQAVDRYYHAYWRKAGCENVSLTAAICLFDAAVNCGVAKARGWWKTIPDPKAFNELRRMFYYRLVDKNPTMKRFLKGWLNRLNDLNKYIEILNNG